MKFLTLSATVLAAGLFATVPAFAQTTPAQKQQTQDGNSPTTVGPGSLASKQRTQDGNSPTTVGPGSLASKQRTQDGNSPTVVGPGSQAYKQRTQDGNSPTVVGPGSQAYKQRTDGNSPTVVGSGSGAYKQKTQTLTHGDGSASGRDQAELSIPRIPWFGFRKASEPRYESMTTAVSCLPFKGICGFD